MRIRQLVWQQPTVGPDEYMTVADADPCVFRYEIDNQGNERKPFRVRRSCNIQCFAWATSLDAAKVCAQRDFEDRIMSAIEYRPTIVRYDEAYFSELVLEDVPTVVGSPMTVNTVLRMSDRELIGFRWQGDTQ
jgi:hypothetical protein